ncbi:MAG: HAD family phosphatase [Deltaproteobacteria bacterium]|nr:HAD family phosphatase [Deltaproteobacteria bacterium]
MPRDAVIFDLGGVVLDSPLHAIARYEREAQIPAGFVNRVVVSTGPQGAWSRLERGELRVEEWVPEFERDCAEAGQAISAARMMEAIRGASEPRPRMIAAIRAIRVRGLRVGALTNNWVAEEPAASRLGQELRGLFDAFVESAVVGLRKPDPRIYRYACDALGVAPEASIFLDDIGANLKAARALGMHTIKVDSAEQAIAELEAVLGFPLG